MEHTKEYTVDLLLSHYETIKVVAKDEAEALSIATRKANTEHKYSYGYSSVWSAEIINP